MNVELATCPECHGNPEGDDECSCGGTGYVPASQVAAIQKSLDADRLWQANQLNAAEYRAMGG